MKEPLHLSAEDLLRLAYGDEKNLITPTVLSRVLISPTVAVELAEGPSSTRNQTLYGVSIAVLKMLRDLESR